MSDPLFHQQREHLIDVQLRGSGVRDERVLQAMRSVPREEFVEENLRDLAYRNAPLSIGCNQTISQPLIVAIMTEALELSPDARVLEIGTGSGYQAAILSQLAAEVFTIERHPQLAETARTLLAGLGYDNVRVREGDGTRGWLEEAPFDGIVVTAAGPSVPESLKNQLKVGGRLVIPVGQETSDQSLLRVIRRSQDEFEEENLGGVRFVPLIGEEGWEPGD